MKRSRLLLVAAALAAGVLLVTAGRSTLGAMGGSEGSRAEDGTTAGLAPEVATGQRPGSEGRQEDRATGTASPSAEPSHPSELAAIDTAAKAEGTAGKGPAGYRLPKVTSRTGPLLEGPLPATASRRGAVVAGYPTSLVPAMTGSTVRSSSVSAHQRKLQIALTAWVGRSPDAVALFYRSRLAPLGFVDRPVAAVGGSTAIAFRRGQHSLVLTLTPQGKRSSVYTLWGTLHPGRD